MAKSETKSSAVRTAVNAEVKKITIILVIGFIFAFVILFAAFYFVLGLAMGLPASQWLAPAGAASLIFGVLFGVLITAVNNAANRAANRAVNIFEKELGALRAAQRQADALQSMASVLRATLSFERVVEEALDVCSVTLENAGVSRNGFVGAVFLFRGKRLYPVAARQMLDSDLERGLPGSDGIVAASFAKAETLVTQKPSEDPELTRYAAFGKAETIVCIPLRAGFQIFGAMVLGADKQVRFSKEQIAFFDAVADQSVIALQNAQLFQRLEEEKERLIAADEEARKELARDLHDGPTQTIAAIAMRVNFIRSLMTRDTQMAMIELQKVEELAKRTAKEIRGMLFTLRPLVLETQGLSAAIKTVMNRIQESDDIDMKLVGGGDGDLLSDSAQSVVFAIVEEALGNARKHAQATRLEVRFWQEDNLFVVRVQDNGVGFDVQDVNRDYSSRGSLGMINLQERAERIDGSIKINSKPGKGTIVTLVVPLDKQGRDVVRRESQF